MVRTFGQCMLLVAVLTAAAGARASEPEQLDVAAAQERMTRLAAQMTGRAAVERPSAPVATAQQDPAGALEASRPLGVPTQTSRLLPKPGESGATGSSGWLWSTLTSLGLVIAVILGLRWAYTRMGGKVVSGSSPVVEVLSRTAVAPRNHVLLLRVGQRVLVVSDSSGGMRTLAQINDEQEVADLLGAVEAARSTSVSASFGQLLGRVQTGYDEPEAEHGLDVGERRADQAEDALSGLLTRVRRLSQGGASR